jgi:hypothetical protein
MLTPLQLRVLTNLVDKANASKEFQELRLTIGPVPPLANYMATALVGKPTSCGNTLRISGTGRLELTPPQGPKTHIRRQQHRALFKLLIRVAQTNLPIGGETKNWMANCLHAKDFYYEAQNELQRTRP